MCCIRILDRESQMMTGYYNMGSWHVIIGLVPQYDHMKGTTMYERYMKGYNETLEFKVTVDDNG